MEQHEAPSLQQPAAPQQPSAPTTVASPSKGLAIFSLVLSILGFMSGIFYIGILLALIGLVLGIISLATHKGAKGMAITGVVIGGICTLLIPITIFFAVNFWQGFSKGFNEEMQKQSSLSN